MCSSLNAQYSYQFYSDPTDITITDNAYDGSWSSMVDKSVNVTGIPSGLYYITASMRLVLNHTWSGDLVIKFTEQSGTNVLGLMSRPGLVEPADDGTGCCGTGVDLAGHLYFEDYADVSSEDLETLGDPVPDYSLVYPSKGAINTSFDTLFSFFNGMPSENLNQTWYFSVGDSGGGDEGTLGEAYLGLAFDDYCVPRLNPNFEHITNVSLNGMDSPTGPAVYPFPNYYTMLGVFTTVTEGQTYPLSVTIDPDVSDFIFAFIDWNQNQVFDSGETYTVVANTDQAGPHTVDITVPADAVSGDTRMRIMLVYNNANPNPCGGSGYDFGETEDYLIHVESSMGTNESSLTAISVYPNPVKDVLTIQSKTPVVMAEVYNLAGQKVLGVKNENKINMESLPVGEYVVKISSDNEVKSFKVVKK